ncbi:hypothetical protein [Tuberibacillus sp. Marseille-P3662]|uniref:hypothetical protein n=1 Tax=Tuberibacillus sp. Marseille-P3662 TaxID=1965358 RepID=UPI000A1C987C|nr:hypothetical protein [Tuberibacillus sp. Marseille-P3662]
MNRYLKLVNFEFNRIAKVFFTLLGLTLIAQIAGDIIISKKYLIQANEAINESLLTKEQFLAKTGPMSMINVTQSLWFLGPIALCAAAVGFYIFLIWYRDWFGKGTFIYRLLMLPTARFNVFLAKITTILLMTFGFVAFQLILLPIESRILKSMVPEDFRSDMSVGGLIGNHQILSIIIPNSMTEFLINYGAGLTAVALIFTTILFERSYRLKGVLMAAGYIGLACLIFISPMLLQSFVLNNFFYTMELFILMILAGLIVLLGSLWMSHFLIKKKITV